MCCYIEVSEVKLQASDTSFFIYENMGSVKTCCMREDSGEVEAIEATASWVHGLQYTAGDVADNNFCSVCSEVYFALAFIEI